MFAVNQNVSCKRYKKENSLQSEPNKQANKLGLGYQQHLCCCMLTAHQPLGEESGQVLGDEKTHT